MAVVAAFFKWKHRLTGDEVKCFVIGQAEKDLAHREIEDVWRGGRISVFGTIHSARRDASLTWK